MRTHLFKQGEKHLIAAQAHFATAEVFFPCTPSIAFSHPLLDYLLKVVMYCNKAELCYIMAINNKNKKEEISTELIELRLQATLRLCSRVYGILGKTEKQKEYKEDSRRMGIKAGSFHVFDVKQSNATLENTNTPNTHIKSDTEHKNDVHINDTKANHTKI